MNEVSLVIENETSITVDLCSKTCMSLRIRVYNNPTFNVKGLLYKLKFERMISNPKHRKRF